MSSCTISNSEVAARLNLSESGARELCKRNKIPCELRYAPRKGVFYQDDKILPLIADLLQRQKIASTPSIPKKPKKEFWAPEDPSQYYTIHELIKLLGRSDAYICKCLAQCNIPYNVGYRGKKYYDKLETEAQLFGMLLTDSGVNKTVKDRIRAILKGGN